MGAAPVVSGVLGAANVIGGMSQASAQRRAQNAQAKQNARALQASLLIERQNAVDQEALEASQLKLARQFASQQATMSQLQRQSESQAFDAAMRVQGLQERMGIERARMQNESELANARLAEIATRGQATRQRFGAEMKAVEGESQASRLQTAVADQSIQALNQARQQFGQSEIDRDASFATDPDSDIAQAQRAASMREGFTGATDISRKTDIYEDEARVQADYIRSISKTLRDMGISEADAMEAAGAVAEGIARAGYDLANIDLNAALALGQQERDIQRTSFYANQDQQKRAEEMDLSARNLAFDTAEATSKLNLRKSLESVERQAKYNTQFGASSPSGLSNALQLASGAYGVYQQMKTPTTPKQQSDFGVSRVVMPSLLASNPYTYPSSQVQR